MVPEHLDLIRCPFAVSPPVLEAIHNGQKLLVIDLVVDFRRLELSGVEGHRVQPSFLVSLRQDGSDREVRSVRFDDHGFGGVEMGKYRHRRKSPLQLLEGFFRPWVPLSFLFTSFCQLRQGSGKSEVILDEAVIEVGESQEGLYFS